MAIDINLNDVASETDLTNHVEDTNNPHAVTKAQVGLGNVDNTSDIDKPVSTAQSAADAVILSSANTYTDGQISTEVTNRNNAIASAVAGLLDFRGDFSAAGGAYPSSGGSGVSGAILKADCWIITVAGTLPTGQVVNAGDFVFARIDTPGNTQANWGILESNIGFTPENVDNKDNGPISPSASKYPTNTAVINYAQPLDSDLTAIADIVGASGDFIYHDGASWVKKTTNQIKNLLKTTVVYGSNNINESHTGDTSPFLLTYQIPIDTSVDEFGVNDSLSFSIRRIVTASGNAKTIKVYIGPNSGSLSGATQIIELNNATGGTTRAAGKRTHYFYGALTSLRGVSLAIATTTSDEINNNNNWSTFTVTSFAPGTTVYILFEITNANAGDSQTLDTVQVIHYKR